MVRIITTLSVATLSILAIGAQPIAFGEDPTDLALRRPGLGGRSGAIFRTAGAVAKTGAKVAKSQVKSQAIPRNHSTGKKSHDRSRKARKAVNLQQKAQNQQQNGEQNTGQNYRREILELQDELEEMLARREMGEEAFDELVERSALYVPTHIPFILDHPHPSKLHSHYRGAYKLLTTNQRQWNAREDLPPAHLFRGQRRPQGRREADRQDRRARTREGTEGERPHAAAEAKATAEATATATAPAAATPTTAAKAAAAEQEQEPEEA
ncbi:hypothetical protein DFP72DRAFT_581248 [Ephemerocybe angulata]|uniref:Uncharacterized protein n=1 Tax=Ephemerocybe angulata TaxID=980116 RepID=A0A8H6LXW5_9AGAR|nr:hypothetical protein DFP72DRAFT_581248 [Tulosesus angulatus]